MLFPGDVHTKVSGVYVITCLGNGKCYVGSAVSLKRRFAEHIKQLREGVHHGVRLQRAWQKYGEYRFLYEVLEIIYNRDDLLKREQLHIDLLGAAGPWGYNSAPTAGSMAGFKHSAVTLAQMSVTRKARGLTDSLRVTAGKVWLGRKHTSAAIAKMKASKQGKPMPIAAVEAALAANLGHGRRHSDETKAKIAAKALGRTTSAANRAAVSKATKGVKWTPERTAKRLATIAAKRAAALTTQEAEMADSERI